MADAQSPRLSDDDRRRRRDTFSAEAVRYDRVRPDYPVEVFDRVAAFGGLTAGVRALEIGAGTGKATRSLVDRCWRVDAIELGEGMAAVFRERLGDRARLVVGAFEDVAIDQAAYDLVLCATAFHWLDPATRVDRVAGALRSGGTAAVIWTRHVRGGTQLFFEASQAVYDRAVLGDADTTLPDESALQPRDAEFRDHDAFSTVTGESFATEVEYDTDSYLDLISTYSETLAARPEQRSVLLDGLRGLIDERFGGRVVKRYVFELVLAHRA